MAWFTDTTNAPKIYDGKNYYLDQYTINIGVPGDTGSEQRTASRPVTETPFRFEGLTRVAADSIAARYANDTSANYTAASERTNDANGYRVKVTQIEYGAWGNS